MSDIKWKVSSATHSTSIVQVKIIKETDKMVTFVYLNNEYIDDAEKPITRKKSGTIFDTFEEAKIFVLKRLENKIKFLRNEVSRLEDYYESSKQDLSNFKF